MACPHCKTPFGPQIPEVQPGATAWCPNCRATLIWATHRADGMHREWHLLSFPPQQFPPHPSA